MYKLCKTEQSAARQRELEQGLLSAMSVCRYEDISVSDLCTHMEIPRKSFYRYFSGKDGALHGLIDHTLLECDSFHWLGEGTGERAYQKDLELFFQFWKEQKPLLDALSRSGLSGVLIERCIDRALSDAGLSRRFPEPEAPELRAPELKAHATMFSVCGLMSMVVGWHHRGYPESAAHMAQIAVKLVTKPLFLDGAR